jgi:hypothetical protein
MNREFVWAIVTPLLIGVGRMAQSDFGIVGEGLSGWLD